MASNQRGNFSEIGVGIKGSADYRARLWRATTATTIHCVINQPSDQIIEHAFSGDAICDNQVAGIVEGGFHILGDGGRRFFNGLFDSKRINKRGSGKRFAGF